MMRSFPIGTVCPHLKTVFFEPTDRRKAIRPLCSEHRITCASPNIVELRAMAGFLSPHLVLKPNGTEINEILRLSEIVSQVVGCLIVTLGAKGVIIIRQINNDDKLSARLYPAQALASVESVSGAGDCFASGFIHGALSGAMESECVQIAFESAKNALLSKRNVPFTLAINGDNIKAHYITLM